MWLFATQGDFPAAADNHGRVVHSHADGAMFYAHGGMWHELAQDDALEAEIAARIAGDDSVAAMLSDSVTALEAADAGLATDLQDSVTALEGC